MRHDGNRHLHLTILPTERCDVRCTYCYEDFAIGKKKRPVVDAIKNLIKRRIDSSGTANKADTMNLENQVFVYDEDGLFAIVDSADADRLSGGIQSSIGTISNEVVSGVFCHYKKSCS